MIIIQLECTARMRTRAKERYVTGDRARRENVPWHILYLPSMETRCCSGAYECDLRVSSPANWNFAVTQICGVFCMHACCVFFAYQHVYFLLFIMKQTCLLGLLYYLACYFFVKILILSCLISNFLYQACIFT